MRNLKKRLLKTRIIILSSFIWLIGLAILNIVLVIAFLILKYNPVQSSPTIQTTDYPEVQLIASGTKQGQQLSDYFKTLAIQKGGAYAYEVLKIAPMPPNTDMHLMGHVVGDQLYKQQGINGIKLCTQDFRNACSHALVVGLLLEKGESVLPEIAKVCHQAPGGKGAYTMCFHGLGHGVLAYSNYEMPKAVQLCKKVGSEAYNNREYIECVGGAVMEIISGGDHDKPLWQNKHDKYLSTADPLAPCNAAYMPDDARGQCYTYLTPHLFITAGANLGNPTPEQFEKAFTYCNNIPEDQKKYRRECFGGFGKEFVVLAKQRDIRNIQDMSEAEVRTVYNWCLLGKTEEAINFCNEQAIQSFYWGGENKPDAAINFCNIMQNQTHQNSCFSSLSSTVKYYSSDAAGVMSFCQRIPETYRRYCMTDS